jgi:hypothetical protein
MSGTKRARIPRTSAPGLISPQAVALYRRALDLRRRGADQETVHAAEADVDRLLGGGVRRLWLVSVFDIDRWPPKPDDLDGQRTLEHRCQLDAAVRDLERQERQERTARRRAAKAAPEPTHETKPEPAV